MSGCTHLLAGLDLGVEASVACICASNVGIVLARRGGPMPGGFGRPLFLCRLLLITLAAILAPVGATGAAAAPSSSTASGEFVTQPGAIFTNIRDLGNGVTIVDLTAHVTYTGTFTGTSIVQGFIVFHRNGSAIFHDTETFTGTVNGKSGTVTFKLTGTAGPAGDVHATQAIVRGTGELANLHGALEQVGTVLENGPAGTYTGQINFSP
jgi:Protein of unknown function (DUF3224)